MTYDHVAQSDPAVAAALAQELTRQRETIELIASENIVSPAVLEAVGSVLTNKYAEGYPRHRYYGGCEKVDMSKTSPATVHASFSAATTPTCNRIPGRTPTLRHTQRSSNPATRSLA